MPPEQNAVTTPSYQLPKQPPSPERRKAIITLGVVVLVILLIIAGIVAAFFYYPPAIAIRSALTMPQELKNAYFLSEGPHGTIAYKLSGLSYVATPLDGTLVSASDQLQNQIVKDQKGYHYSVNGKESRATKSQKLGIAYLSNGSWVVYAALNSATSTYTLPLVPISNFTVDGTAWHLNAERTTATSTIIARGPIGTSPTALDQNNIVYLSPGGVSVWNVNSGKTTLLATQITRYISTISLASPDHSYIGYLNAQARTITVYHVTPTSAEKVATVPEGKFTSYVLGNDGVYAVNPSFKGTQIWKASFNSPTFKQIAFLPVTLNVTKLLVGSL